jgi:hypothetical protein
MEIHEIEKLLGLSKTEQAIKEIISLTESSYPKLRSTALLLSARLQDCINEKTAGVSVASEMASIRCDAMNFLEVIKGNQYGNIVNNSKETNELLKDLEEIQTNVINQWKNANSDKESYYFNLMADLEDQIFSLKKEGSYSYSKTQAYLLDRIKTYESLVTGTETTPAIDFQNTTFNRLKKELLNKKKVFEKPISINVRGTIFPSALLSSGWWERLDDKTKEFHKWKDGLQNWLFQGFDLWGPSWDFSWHSFDDNCSFAIAQLGEGEEANTIPVIIHKDIAIKLKSDIENSNDPWGGKEVQVSGIIGHKKHFAKKANKIEIVGGLMDYCIFLDGNNSKHKIAVLNTATEIYSGYLWKCVSPKLWLDNFKEINLDDVYFIWEHTDFTKEDAVKYNLDSLQQKERYIEKLYGSLVLLQKSSSHVPGETLWTSKLFYQFLQRNAVKLN